MLQTGYILYLSKTCSRNRNLDEKKKMPTARVCTIVVDKPEG